MRNDLYWDSLLSVIQMVVLGVEAMCLIRYGLSERCRGYRKAVLLHAAGVFCVALGDLFVVLFLFLRKEWPSSFNASDVAWLGCFLFFSAAEKSLKLRQNGKRKPYVWILTALPVLVHVITTVLYKNWISDLFWAAALTYYAWIFASGFCRISREKDQRHLRLYHVSMILFLLTELVMFLSWGMVYVLLDLVMLLVLVSSGYFLIGRD